MNILCGEGHFAVFVRELDIAVGKPVGRDQVALGADMNGSQPIPGKWSSKPSPSQMERAFIKGRNGPLVRFPFRR